MSRCLDADLDVVALDRENDHFDLVTNPDALLSFPAQDEHDGSWRSSWGREGRARRRGPTRRC
jgi:hypothetical protein